MFQQTSIIEKPQNDSQRILVRQLYKLMTGTFSPHDNFYCLPHDTARFDLLLLDGLSSSDLEEQRRMCLQ